MISDIVLVIVFVLYTLYELTDAKPETDGEKKKLGDRETVLIVICCGCVCCLAFVFDAVYYLTTMTMFEKYNTPRKSLLALIDDKSDVIEPKTLESRVREILAMKPADKDIGGAGEVMEKLDQRDQAKIDAFLAGIAQASQDEPTELVTGARDRGLLPIRKQNRFTLKDRSTNLHISELTDLYGNPLLLTAAPLPDQFADHWEAIWQARVGVVVWVGRLITHELRMDAYIDLRVKHSVTYGKFRIETMESGDLMYKFALYYVKVHRGRESRPLIFIHAYEWLQESVSWALAREVEVLMCIKDEHIRRIKKNDLRGIMFQCKYGTAGSCSLSAVYLGLQFWLRDKKVNFYGILRYIRRMRPLAFEHTGERSQSFFVQIQVAYAAMYAVAKFVDTKKVPPYEKWIKELLAKSSFGTFEVSVHTN